MAISNNIIVVGASDADIDGHPDQGAAYVFEREGDFWVERQILVAADGGAFDGFGDSVNLAGDIAIVGAIGNDHSGLTDAGAAYLFTRTGSHWVEREKCTTSDPANDDQFAFGFPISGDTVIFGSPGDDHSGLTDAGSAYVFRLALFADGFESGDNSGWTATVP